MAAQVGPGVQMDGDSLAQAKTVAEEASKHGAWFSEAWFAVGAAVAGFVGGRKLWAKAPREFDDDHPLVAVLREEGSKTRATIHDEMGKTRDAIHAMSNGIEYLKGRVK